MSPSSELNQASMVGVRFSLFMLDIRDTRCYLTLIDWETLTKEVIMSMGYGGAYADVIEAKSVKSFCKKEYAAFIRALKADGAELEEFAMEAESGEAETSYPIVNKAFEAMTEAFYKRTKLPLSIAHHQSDECGDIYDGVDGTYFYVDGMWALTKEGRNMCNLVERKMFVQFG